MLVLVAKGICTPEEIDDGKQLLLRIASMLTKLIMRFDSSSASSVSVVREAPQKEEFEREEEDENENGTAHSNGV